MHDLANYISAANALASSLRELAAKVQAVAAARLMVARAMEEHDTVPADAVRAVYRAQREMNETYTESERLRRDVDVASDALLRSLEVRNG